MQQNLAVATEATAPSRPVTEPPEESRGRHPIVVAAEVVLALAAAAVMVLLSVSVDVNPLDRIGQVSGLAGLQLRFAVVGVLVLAAMVLFGRLHGGRWRQPAVRFGCALVAGLASGMVAGGVVLALRGTSLPLFGHEGDVRVLTQWADSILAGHSTMPGDYPPGLSYGLAWWSSIFGTDITHAFKDFEIIVTALLGPAAYLSWRLLFRPIPALAIGLASTLPLIYPYKPYEPLVLIVMVPVLIKAVQFLMTTPQHRPARLVLVGAGFGAGIGVLFLIYSAWFLWAVPGVVAAAAITFPWRRGALRGLLFGAVTTGVFLLVSAVHLVPLVADWSKSKQRDTYFYFDTFVDPSYIAMWRTDLPGEVATWPPFGELGGVGLFTLLLVVGLAVAIALGHRHPVVITASCGFAGAWLARFWYASDMYQAQDVRLYPRSAPFILYCLLVLTMMAGYLALQRLRASWPEFLPGATTRLRGVSIGVVAAMLLLVGSAGSAIADRYMPRDGISEGRLAWTAHVERMPNGKCSAYLLDDCSTIRREKPLQEPAYGRPPGG